jgi:cytoskeleton protein RodZ
VPKVDEWETVGDKRFRWSGWLSAVVLVAVMLICSAVYAWIQRPKPSVAAKANRPVQSQPPPSTAATQPAPPLQTAAATPAAPAPSASTPAAVPGQPQEQKPPEPKPADPQAAAQKPPDQPAEQKPAAAAPTPNPNATVHVEITADEAVWLSAHADGKYSFSATLNPHATRTIDGVKEVTLRLGNAGGVSISLNGKPIGPAGPKGQVRTIQFTSGGFQIVPAKSPSVPLDPLDRL